MGAIRVSRGADAGRFQDPSASGIGRGATGAAEIDGADAVINLAGRSVNCRYTDANKHAMMSSRVDSTRAVGEVIANATRPPRVWLQMSTATIYAHRFDAANDEANGCRGFTGAISSGRSPS